MPPSLVPRAQRGSVFLMAVIGRSGGTPTMRHRVRDISTGGVRVDNAAGLRPGTAVVVSIGALQAVEATVRWARDGLAGIAFDTPIDPGEARKKPPAAPDGIGAATPAAPAGAASPASRKPVVGTGWIDNMWDPYRR